MGKVTAWQCIHCEALFPKKNLMENHRKAAEARRQAAIEKAHSFRLELEDLNEIPGIIENLARELGRFLEVTLWELKFDPKMAPTHDAPIGKPTQWKAAQGEERVYYAGWRGRIKTRGNLFSKPIEHESATFGKISCVSDLFKIFIKGVHTGSGGGGDAAGYEVRLYLDDFPKLKAKYEQWRPEAKKYRKHIQLSEELSRKANHDLIVNDPRTLELNAAQEVLQARLRQIQKERNKIFKDIQASKEYAEATKVPEEYKYDADVYYSLEGLFATNKPL